MSQLKAKQLKLAAEGDLLVGGASGTGTSLSATGKADQILRVVDGKPAWSVNDNLKSENTFNTVTAATTGVKLAVQNADGDAAVDLATFKSGSAADEAFEFSSAAGALTVAAVGTATDIDIVIAPKGGGDVVIGNAGGGILQADDNEDLALFGGEGSGNLLLNGGGTGKIYYASDANDPDLEIATKGDIAAATSGSAVTQTRSEFDGSQTFTLDTKTIPASIIAHVNGLVVKQDVYAYNVTSKVVTFTGLGYTLDNVDQVVFTYEVTA
jgi:hypothetical protein